MDEVLATRLDGQCVMTVRSFGRLAPGKWLTDEVLDYFAGLCLEASDDTHLMYAPPTVYTTIVQGREPERMFWRYRVSEYRLPRRERAKRPGRRPGDVHRLVMPLNLNNNHWTVVVAFPQHGLLWYLDSLGGRPPETIAEVAELLGIQDVTVETPLRQHNGYDCGVYVAYVMYHVFRAPPTAQPDDILQSMSLEPTAFRRYMARSILKGSLAAPSSEPDM